MDTTVISDAVNLASRVENLTKTYGVPLIITEETYQALQNPSQTTVRRIDRVLVQGRSQAVVLYEVLDAEQTSERSAKISSLKISKPHVIVMTQAISQPRLLTLNQR